MIVNKAHAQDQDSRIEGTYNLLVPVGQGEDAVTVIETGVDAKEVAEQYLFTDLFNFVIVLAALLAVISLAIMGFLLVLSQIKGDVFGYQKWRDRFVNAIFGIILLLCSYVILKTINPELVKFGGFNIPTENPPAQSSG